jgi:hypothetical protein
MRWRISPDGVGGSGARKIPCQQRIRWEFSRKDDILAEKDDGFQSLAGKSLRRRAGNFFRPSRERAGNFLSVAGNFGRNPFHHRRLFAVKVQVAHEISSVLRSSCCTLWFTMPLVTRAFFTREQFSPC